MRNNYNFYIVFILLGFFGLGANAQSNCDSLVPSFSVNLTSSPTATWTSPTIQRDGNCCGTTNPDKCLEFILTMHPNAISVNFVISSGAVPTGSMFYQIDCGPQVPVGTPICLDGAGPHVLTFCKPGDNENTYTIQSISEPIIGPDIDIAAGCTDYLHAQYYDESTITWTSLSPGNQGDYNSLLSCVSACDTTYLTSQNVNNPNVIDYYVCGYDAAGCIDSAICDTIVVNLLDLHDVSISATDTVLCSYETSSTLTVSSTGGTGNFTYLWSTGDTTTSITVGPGTYYVDVLDTSGCSSNSDTLVITQLPEVIVNAGPDIDVCNQSAQEIALAGSVQNATGVLWSGGNGTFPLGNTILNATYLPTASELLLSNIELYIESTGNQGCNADVDTVLINLLPFLDTVSIATTDVNCYNGTDGSSTTTVNGTQSPWTFNLNNSTSNTSGVFTNLGAGNFLLEIVDNLGCSHDTTFTILQPDTLIMIVGSQTNVNCFGDATGSATATVTGGTAPYSYSWNTVPAQTTATAINLAAGTYTCTVTDDNGCIETVDVTITQPTAPLALTISAQTNVNCFGDATGAATIGVTGGTSGYTYAWNTTPVQTTATATGLVAGTYTCTVTDNVGCLDSIQVTITEPTAPLTASILSTTPVDCFGTATGSATVTAQDGTPGYTYSWNSTPVQTTPTATNLIAGTYVCTVTDNLGCTDTAVAVITQPAAALSASISSTTNIDCYGDLSGTATATAQDGTPGYTYAWNTVPVQTTATASGLSAGYYTCTVTDALGCTETITVVIAQPSAPLALTMTNITNVNCFGDATGAATVTANDGTPGYTYAWNTTPVQTTATATGLVAGTYTCTVTDANGCIETINATITQPAAALSLTIGSTTNVNCYGDATGAATVVAANGTPGYTYSWNTTPVQTTATASGLVAGTYTCTVTDALGCIETISVTITQPAAPLTATITSTTPVSCYGDATGAATASAAGGTSAYTYSWNTTPVQTTATATGLVAGTYTCTITDALGCTTTINATITQPAGPLTASITSTTDVNCFGDATGSATAAAADGTAGYTYSWNTTPVQTSATATGLIAGTYTCTITDANGCTTTTSAVITQPAAPLSATITNTVDVACYGNATGSATASGANGTPGYTYSWNTAPVQTTATASGLAAGTYTCTITDALGCITTVNATIAQPTAPLSLLVNPKTNVTCYGDATGSATVVPSNGTPGYTYSWNTTPVQTTATASGLAAGTYTCTVTDANGCIETVDVTITQPAGPLTLSTVAISDVDCYGDATGAATIQATLGTPGYTYAWNTVPVQTTSTASGLSAGSYTCTVTDALGCIETITVVIAQPSAPLSASITNFTNINCYGDPTGTATVSAQGGTPGYNYSWNTSPVQTTATASGLTAGTYTCTITDLLGCTETVSITLTQPAAPLVINLAAKTNVDCFGNATGSATANVTGGTINYAYAWNTTPVQTTATATNLVAGSYTCTVTDANGCTATLNVTINQPTAALTSVISASTNIDCFGNATGAATVSASNGTPGYTYAWNTIPVQTGSTASGLVAGTYTCTVTDANGCTSSSTVTLTQPNSPLGVSITGISNVDCYGDASGSASVMAFGGTAGYTYQWSTSPVQNTPMAVNLTAGTYTCIVTDANGCSESVTVTITQPTAPLALTTIAKVNVACYGDATGTVTINAAGGTPNYSYTWNTNPVQNTATATGLTAGNYTCVVVDALGCSDSIIINIAQPNSPMSFQIDTTVNVLCFGDATGSISITGNGGTPGYDYIWSHDPTLNAAYADNLVAGHYECTVLDQNGCEVILATDVTEPSNPLELSITSISDVNCYGGNDGSATIAAQGGTPGYTYSWNTTPVQTTPTAINLTAGLYTCVVTDTNGCSESMDVIINQPNSPLIVSLNALQNVSCFNGVDGSATVFVEGGTPNYTYAWNTAPIQTTATASGLSAGTYTCTVTDANGCSEDITITISQPINGVSASILTKTNVNCFGGNNGAVTITAAGGTPGYTYAWNTVPAQFSNTITGLSAGTYTCTVTDANGCAITIDATITEPSNALGVNLITQQDISCHNGSDGFITVMANGGTPGYTYFWNTNPVQNGPTVMNLTAGTYTCTVTDDNGCQSITSVTLTEPSTPLSLSINDVIDVDCFGNSTGSAFASVNGGTPGYTYTWNTSPSQTNDTLLNVPAGTYSCEVEDSNGCLASAGVTINQPAAPLTLSINEVNDVACYGNNTGSASVVATGGTAGYTYVWNTIPQQFTDSAVGLSAGTYTCTVTDSNGCTESILITITQPQQALDINLVTQQNVSCYDGANAAITVNAFGGTANYNYIWNADSSEQANTITNLMAGTHQVLVTDANGCLDSLAVLITEPNAPLQLNLTQVTPILCNGDANGEIEVEAVGGTPNYAFTWLNNSNLVGANIIGLDAQIYTGIVTDANGCTDTLEVPLDDPALLEAIITSDTALCFGAQIDVTVSPVGGTGNYYYDWTPNLSNTNVLSDIPGQDQIYTCTVTDDNNCSVTVSTTVIVHYTDPDDITAISDQLTMCEFDSVQLTYSFASSTIGLDIEWLHCPTCDPNQPVFAQILSDTMFIISATNQCNQTVYDTVYVNYFPVPVVDIALNSDTICEFNTVSFFNYGDNNPSWSYTWDFGDGNTSTSPSPENFYTYNGSYDVSLSITDNNGCTSLDTASAMIVVNPQAISSFTVDPGLTGTMDDPVFEFTNTSIHANEFIYTFGDGNYSFQPHPTHMYESFGQYNVIQVANNEFNCPDTSVQVITIKATHGVYVPNAFTPDGDNYNNTFFPEAYGLAKDGYHMQIFNRWGEIIFESFEITEGWDGYYRETPVQDGVYTWVIYYKTLDNQVHKQVGHVTVLR